MAFTRFLDKTIDSGYDSLFKINCEAFFHKDASNINLNLKNFEVNYSSYSLVNNLLCKKTKFIDIVSKVDYMSCEMDGYDEDQLVDDDIYLCKLIFNVSYIYDVPDIRFLIT